MTGYVSARQTLALTSPTGEPQSLTMPGGDGQNAMCPYKGMKESKTFLMQAQEAHTKAVFALQSNSSTIENAGA